MRLQNLHKIIHFNYVSFVLNRPAILRSLLVLEWLTVHSLCWLFIFISIAIGNGLLIAFHFSLFSSLTALLIAGESRTSVSARTIEWNSRPTRNTLADAIRKRFALRFKCHSFLQMKCPIWYANRKEYELRTFTWAKIDWSKEICHSAHSRGAYDCWVLTQFYWLPEYSQARQRLNGLRKRRRPQTLEVEGNNFAISILRAHINCGRSETIAVAVKRQSQSLITKCIGHWSGKDNAQSTDKLISFSLFRFVNSSNSYVKKINWLTTTMPKIVVGNFDNAINSLIG